MNVSTPSHLAECVLTICFKIALNPYRVWCSRSASIIYPAYSLKNLTETVWPLCWMSKCLWGSRYLEPLTHPLKARGVLKKPWDVQQLKLMNGQRSWAQICTTHRLRWRSVTPEHFSRNAHKPTLGAVPVSVRHRKILQPLLSSLCHLHSLEDWLRCVDMLEITVLKQEEQIESDAMLRPYYFMQCRFTELHSKHVPSLGMSKVSNYTILIACGMWNVLQRPCRNCDAQVVIWFWKGLQKNKFKSLIIFNC